MFETVRCWSLSFYESFAQLVLFFSLCVVVVKFWGITWWKRKSLPEIAMQIVTARARSLSLRYGSYFGSWSMRMITWSNLTPSHETVLILFLLPISRGVDLRFLLRITEAIWFHLTRGSNSQKLNYPACSRMKETHRFRFEAISLFDNGSLNSARTFMGRRGNYLLSIIAPIFGSIWSHSWLVFNWAMISTLACKQFLAPPFLAPCHFVPWFHRSLRWWFSSFANCLLRYALLWNYGFAQWRILRKHWSGTSRPIVWKNLLGWGKQ